MKTLASSPDGQEEIKMFLFAQHVRQLAIHVCSHKTFSLFVQVSTFNFFLVEIMLMSSLKKIKMTVKTDNPKLTDQFYLHIMDALKSCLLLKKL